MSRSSIKKNFMYQLSYDVLIMILPFVTSPYIARVIGAEGLGIYSYQYSIANYFVLFSVLGLRNYGNRTIAKVRDHQETLNQTFSDLLALHVLVSLICCAGYGVYACWISEYKLYAAIMGFQACSGLLDISWFYFGMEQFRITVLRNFAIKLLNVCLIFSFVRNAGDLWKYCLIMSGGIFLSQLVMWFPLKKYVTLVRPHREDMFKHLKPMLVLFIPVIAVSLYKYMDKIMLGSMGSKIQLGYYENAEKVISIPITAITSFGAVMLPRMTNMKANGQNKQSEKYIRISMFYVMWLAYALAFGIAAVADVFAPVFWGDEFTASGKLMMGLAVTIPFMSFANVIRTQFLIPSERDKDYIASVVAGAAVNLIINLLLIPKYGASGAVIGTIAAEGVVCIVQCVSVRRELAVVDYFRRSVMFVFLGILMFTAVNCVGAVLGTRVITLICQVVTGVFVYGLLSIVFSDDIKELIYARIGVKQTNK